MKKSIAYPVDDMQECRIKMLNWSSRFNIFCFLDNRQYASSFPGFECLLAAGAKKILNAPAGRALDQLKTFQQQAPGEWLFGYLGYDLKNEIELLVSEHADYIGFSDLQFFVPEIVVELGNKEMRITADDTDEIYRQICGTVATIAKDKITAEVQSRLTKDEYIVIIEKLKQHIRRGDCYEINFCQEFFAEAAEVNPLQLYDALSVLSPNPFAVLYRSHDKYCIGASPERYLKKTGNTIYSQPIKGTSKRQLAQPEQDEAAKLSLLNMQKEKSEHVMVVDLVRNDLSRICREGTVTVEELYGLYSFPQVHQMISTIKGEPEVGLDLVDCIRATFPMGSMTGAPKKRVMELIEQYEISRRGLFSGAIGYVNPAGDFDFNVVIRSLFYAADKKYLSFQTGGAITFHSDPIQEYDECLLKATAMMKVLQ